MHEAFLRLQEDADRSSPRRPWRPSSRRAAGAGAAVPSRAGLGDSREPTMRVTLQAVPRPQAGPALLGTALHNSGYGTCCSVMARVSRTMAG